MRNLNNILLFVVITLLLSSCTLGELVIMNGKIILFTIIGAFTLKIILIALYHLNFKGWKYPKKR